MKKVKGYLKAKGTKIVNEMNEPILLTGWGLGNWLLTEGYMWLAGDLERFDRPRRMEQTLIELTGEEYARYFWKTWKERYITKDDIKKMSDLGYNSVRIPINWRILMEETEAIIWKEDGFIILDRCLEWCEEFGLYAFLDLHGAPGGQTGANIDDCEDDVPRLFTDPGNMKKCKALWSRLAERYRDREIVGGYDLLNEPICPPNEKGNHDDLIPILEEFYIDLIKEIRKVDPIHMLSVEGAHWATDLSVFQKKFDDNMVLHFHRYAVKPEKKCLEEYLEKAEELGVPLWLGETGENTIEWYAALYPLAISMGIGYNLWPWKKMECTNSPCSVKRPKDYDLILDYLKGGIHPGHLKSQEIFNELLDNIQFENCIQNEAVSNHVFRKPPFSMYAVDFDELPGPGTSFYTEAQRNFESEYRKNTGMNIVRVKNEEEPKFAFDCQWDKFALNMETNDFVSYTISEKGNIQIIIELSVLEEGTIQMECEKTASRVEISKQTEIIQKKLYVGEDKKIVIKVLKGKFQIGKLIFKSANPF